MGYSDAEDDMLAEMDKFASDNSDSDWEYEEQPFLISALEDFDDINVIVDKEPSSLYSCNNIE